MTVLDVPAHTHPRAPRLRPVLKRLRARSVSVLLASVAVVFAPHKASLKRLTEIPLTVCGVAAIDFAGFHIAHGWGWLITGLSLIVVEHLIADG